MVVVCSIEEALEHWKEAVTIMPLVPEIWFLMGIGYMDVEKWEDAATAFTRVVQQEPDDGRAWGNLGAIHTKNKDFVRALAAFKEGVRHNRDSVHMWENYLICATKLEQLFDVVTAFQRLMDLRQAQANSKWEIDVEILDFLVHRAVVDPASVEGEGEDGPARALLQKRVAELLGRASSIVSTDGRLWGVYATFNEAIGRDDQALDCRTKACRAMVNKTQWTKDEASVNMVLDSLDAMAKAYIRKPTAMQLQQCLMFLKSPLQKLSQEPWEGSAQQERAKAIMQSVEEAVVALKAASTSN